MTDKTYDYIVIGSGFGGAVSSMRLAEKGYSVLTLEKGRDLQAKDFPKTNWNIRKFFWAPIIKCFGLQQLTIFKDLLVLSGVGVGGGSLVYANTLMFPPDDFFNNPIWSDLKDWKQTLSPFYDKARTMLGVTPNPLINREDDILKEIAKDMNRQQHYSHVDVAVYFGDKDKEVDPYFKGLGPLRSGCTECAGCMVGCRYNAKNTLDKNYLYFAQKFGAKIKAETKVEKIEYIDGVYIITTHASNSLLKFGKKIYKSKNLIMSAGVIGTMDLLLKQKYHYKTLPHLPIALGENLRTNSESLCAVTAPKEKLNNGIAISSIFNPDADTHVEVVKYPDGSNIMKILTTLAARPPFRVLKFFKNIIIHPVKVFKVLTDSDWAKKTIIFLIMQSLDNSMKIVCKTFPFFRLSIKNKGQNKVPSYIESGQNLMGAYAEKINGTQQNGISELLLGMATTAHILGGSPLGIDKNTCVVNEKFQVHGQPNMMILDGSIVPCNIGVNPSLTITALSEYAMSLIDKNDTYPTSLEDQLAAIPL
jgi:cholesterol oxidase